MFGSGLLPLRAGRRAPTGPAHLAGARRARPVLHGRVPGRCPPRGCREGDRRVYAARQPTQADGWLGDRGTPRGLPVFGHQSAAKVASGRRRIAEVITADSTAVIKAIRGTAVAVQAAASTSTAASGDATRAGPRTSGLTRSHQTVRIQTARGTPTAKPC